MRIIKQCDQKGLDFIVNEEGLKLVPYLDSVGIPTIGVGCTYYENGKRVSIDDPAITKERAYSLFKNLLKLYEKTIWSYTVDDINQNQFNALTSICFNIGVNSFKNSTLLRIVNSDRNNKLITSAFLMWKKPIELLPRRKREAKLYFS